MPNMRLDRNLAPACQKSWLYYIALTADIVRLSDERGLAEIILDLAYGAADVMQEEAAKERPTA